MRRSWVWMDGRGLVEIDPRRPPARRLEIMADGWTHGVRSPVDGTWLDSRAAVREHNRRHDCEDVGGDAGLHRPRRPQPMPPVADSIRDAIELIHAGKSATLEAATASDMAHVRRSHGR